jgi:hypothetical protein
MEKYILDAVDAQFRQPGLEPVTHAPELVDGYLV